MEASDRVLLREAATGSIGDAHARGGGTGAVDEALAQLGWPEMLRAEPRDAVDVVFTTIGSVGATSTALDDVLLAALGVEPDSRMSVVLPAYATWAPPGTFDGTTARATGLTTARGSAADELVVVCGDGSRLWRVVTPAAAAEVTGVRGVDPDGGLHSVRLEVATPIAEPVDVATWDGAVASARRALAHQTAGACRTMLALARAHATERVQFGRPIAEFQAVRHRLADALVAIEAFDATLAAAWDARGPLTAAVAKAVAGRTGRTVAAHCQQVLAGTGFTTDHPFHRFLARVLALDGLFGSADDLVVEIGRALIAERAVPTLVEL